MKILQLFNKLTDRINEVIMFIFAVVLILSCFAQICTRLAGVPLSWSEELSRYLAVWLTFIGAAYALRRKSLATVEILLDKCKGNSKKILFIIISLFVIVFSIILIRYGWAFSMRFMRQTSPALHIPKGLVYLSAPISGVLMCLYQLEILIDTLKKGKEAE
jgi:TRAP-type C4-dicarboxylate transport system permease small subunit